jgi:hypothetical protein
VFVLFDRVKLIDDTCLHEELPSAVNEQHKDAVNDGRARLHVSFLCVSCRWIFHMSVCCMLCVCEDQDVNTSP